jgi:hypothetical protein
MNTVTCHNCGNRLSSKQRAAGVCKACVREHERGCPARPRNTTWQRVNRAPRVTWTISLPGNRNRVLEAYSEAYGRQIGAPYTASWSWKREDARQFRSSNEAYRVASVIARQMKFPCGSVELMVHARRPQPTRFAAAF